MAQEIALETQTIVYFLLAGKKETSRPKHAALHRKRNVIRNNKAVPLYVYLCMFLYLFIPNLFRICVYICVCTYTRN